LGHGAFARSFDPVEAGRAQQDEVNDQRKCEQESAQTNEGLTRVEKKPESVHGYFLLGQHGKSGFGRFEHAVAVHARQPGSPHPRKDVSHHSNRGED
jgi:hypothetical protein